MGDSNSAAAGGAREQKERMKENTFFDGYELNTHFL